MIADKKCLEAFGGGEVAIVEARRFTIDYKYRDGIAATYQGNGFVLIEEGCFLCYSNMGKLQAIFPREVVTRVDYDV